MDKKTVNPIKSTVSMLASAAGISATRVMATSVYRKQGLISGVLTQQAAIGSLIFDFIPTLADAIESAMPKAAPTAKEPEELFFDEPMAEEAVAEQLSETAPIAEAPIVAVEETPAVVTVETAPVEVDAATDDEEENDAFGSGLEFFDVADDPARYAELLAAEERGELQLVTRYRQSYQARVIMAQDTVKEYYSALKNAFLCNKGIKSRISWGYESFNRGRVHVAKMNVKSRVIYLYLALNPADFADAKYKVEDLSEKKKYQDVPLLIKIEGERKFKYALELIQKLCAEDLQLPPVKNFTETDYREEYRDINTLVGEGLVRKLVAVVQ